MDRSNRFSDLPQQARVWVYVANRQLLDDEVRNIQLELESFVHQWTAHRQALKAAAEVQNGRFLLLGIDESQAGASGCSIDASVHFLQQLGAKYKVDFFERMTFFADNGEGFLPYHKDAFVEAYSNKELTDESPVVDPLVTTKEAFDTSFVKPLKDSWHRRFV